LGSSNRHKAEELQEVIGETLLYGFKPAEALKYISIKLGRDIHPGHYRRVRRFLISENSVNLWLNHQARVGFIMSQRRNIDQIRHQQRELLNDILHESLRPQDARTAQTAQQRRRNDWLLLNMRRTYGDLVKLEFEMTQYIPLAGKLKAMSVQKEVKDAKARGVPLDRKLMDQLWQTVDN
jgi:hypothetical protein